MSRTNPLEPSNLLNDTSFQRTTFPPIHLDKLSHESSEIGGNSRPSSTHVLTQIPLKRRHTQSQPVRRPSTQKRLAYSSSYCLFFFTPALTTLLNSPGQDQRSQVSFWPLQRQLVWPTTEPPKQAGRITLQSTRASRLAWTGAGEGAARAPMAKRASMGRVENCILSRGGGWVGVLGGCCRGCGG